MGWRSLRFPRWREASRIAVQGWFAGVAALVLVASFAEARTREIRFASGSLGGVYRDVAEQARGDLRKQGIALQFVESSDGAENLSHLTSGAADFGLVPQDLVSEDLHAHPEHGLVVVDRVFFDDLHILVRQPLHIDRASDLYGLRIWAGEKDSASRLTTERLFDSLGTPLENLDRNVSFEKTRQGKAESSDLWEMERAVDHLSERFASRELDAAILVTAPGTPALCRLVGSGKASLLSLDRGTLRRLAMEDSNFTNRFLRQITIDHLNAGTYPNQQETVKTVAIPVLLVARKGVDVALALSLRNALLREWSRMANDPDRQGCRLSKGVPNAKPLVQSRLPLLRIPRNGPSPIPMFPLLLGAAVLMVAGLASRLMHADRSRLLSRGRRFLHDAWTHYRWITSCFLLLLIGILGVTALTYYAEREINDNFATPLESFWSITVCLLSGLEDRVPYTHLGHLGVIIALCIGGAFAILTSALVTREVLMTEKKMPVGMKDHFLILNWNERLSELVRELGHPLLNTSKRTPIVVLTDKKGLTLGDVVNLGDSQQGELAKVYLKAGNPTQEQALLQANAHTARCILILADDDSSDEQTIRSILMLRKIAGDKKRKDLHVVAELTNADNAYILNELAPIFPGLLEQVAGLRVRTCLLAQTALNAGIAGFYTDLLSVTDESNEVYTQEIPCEVVMKGTDFREYAARVLTEPKDPMVPVGIQRSTNGRPEVLINPKRGSDEGRLREGDRLVLIGMKPPPPSALPGLEEDAVRS